MNHIEVAIIGDMAFNHDITPTGEKTSYGGAACYSAIGAARFSERIGVVARVGDDFDLSPLKRRGVNVEGVEVVKSGRTCRFIITQHADNTRDFKAIRGVAEVVDTAILPDKYLEARYIHLSSQLPQHAITWLDRLDLLAHHSIVSVDSFETFVRKFPALNRRMFKRADMIFTNEAEWAILGEFGYEFSGKPIVIKRGSKGVIYKNGNDVISIPAPKVNVVDTTGAGDVLVGAFLAQRANDIPIETALFNAVATASLSVTEFGVGHIPTKSSLKKEPEVVTAVLVVNKYGEVLLGKSPKFNHSWIVPGGHPKKRESLARCALREVKEEFGIVIGTPRFLRTHERFVPEYGNKGVRFLAHNYWARTETTQKMGFNKEYEDSEWIDPKEALKLDNLHFTARDIINYYLEGREYLKNK